ncbi:hypothetical protein [Plantactinospora endophytica]|uniref:Uncharacterized protein n=1 Tax=Plantactinospora endophytica TaxID=673535 RepID=A0ABQ4DX40_9ACTN|nr:hypothetical protein [Plantactinospora endophytica]GIG86641.1 hypothetical protein Pen02_15770 [Plantactinospora endophytica]
MDITGVKATISRGDQAAQDGGALMQGVQGQIEEARLLTATTAHDSAHSEVEAATTRLHEALRESSRVIELLRSGGDSASDYASRL